MTEPVAVASSLVTARQVRVVAIGIALGLVLLAIGWAGTRGKETFDDQLSFLSVATVGSGVAAAAQAGFLLSARRSVGRRRAALLRPRVRLAAAPAFQAEGTVADTVHLADGRWYHRPGCALVTGKPLATDSPPPSLTPCPTCEP